MFREIFFECFFFLPTVPPAGSFLRAQKGTKKAPEPHGSGPPSNHPRFFDGLPHPGLSTGNRAQASEVNRCFSIRVKEAMTLHPGAIKLQVSILSKKLLAFK